MNVGRKQFAPTFTDSICDHYVQAGRSFLKWRRFPDEYFVVGQSVSKIPAPAIVLLKVRHVRGWRLPARGLHYIGNSQPTYRHAFRHDIALSVNIENLF